MKKLRIFTDGAARGNPGRGGYGAILIWGSIQKEISGGYKMTTNNRMELLAVIKALELLNRESLEIDIYSDSKYVIDSVMKGWVFGWEKKGWGDKKNIDLWKEYLKHHRKHRINFIWVKGHADNPFNNRCDVLATTAADGANLGSDINYEREYLGV